jgi:cation diffusion facilitator CzcD-associated flavoprotein CzcO
MAIALRRAGITDLTIYEKAQGVGGTWRDNTYPGLTCDVPSRFYQFSFARKPDWSHLFSPGAEIHDYFTTVAHDFGLKDSIRFGTEVVHAEFAENHWRVLTSNGDTDEVDFLITATGILHHPRYPRIAGLETFAGAVFHSARWDHDVALRGKRVAVVGTGSTGVQIVCGLAGHAGHVELFQRSAQWVFPFPNPAYSRLGKALHRSVPALGRSIYYGYRAAIEFFAGALVKPGWRRRMVSAACRANLRTVRDPQLRQALMPDHQPMCRRLIISGRFYRAIQRRDVDLVAAGIDHVTPEGILTTDGRLHEVDVIALATGFDAHAFMRPMNLVGERGVTLAQAWRDGPRAHLTVSLPGFPNFFMLLGPHSPVGNYSLTAIAETQAGYILDWIQRWRRREFDTVAPTQAATERFNAEMQAAMPDTVWATGCTSWYIGQDGHPELWPWNPSQLRVRLGQPELGDHDLRFQPATIAQGTLSPNPERSANVVPTSSPHRRPVRPAPACLDTSPALGGGGRP